MIAASNRSDMLDPALVRPGRFDRELEISMPDRAGRLAILEVHARGKKLADDADLDAVAGVTPGFSGADLANIINEAGLLAARKRLSAITKDALEEAVERVLLGIASSRHIMTEEERRIVAYHEAGHALVGLSLPGVTVPHKVSIVPRGKALGYVWNVEDDRVIQPRSALMNQMAMGFGGRTAEELVIGEPGSGAGNDLANVTQLARHMVCELGMSDALGGVTYGADGGGPNLPSPAAQPSDEEARVIGEEVRKLVDEAHERAREVLTDSREALDRIAQALLERETITAAELETLVRPPAPAAA